MQRLVSKTEGETLEMHKHTHVYLNTHITKDKANIWPADAA